jgi:hypothetical protein
MIEWTSTGNMTEIMETIRQLESLRSRVAALGCPIMAGSRIATFEQHLRRFLDPAYHPRSDPEFDPAVLAHGGRDLFELNFICDKLAGSHPTQLRAALPHLLSGPAVPQEKGRNEMPRNLQFQFFLAAQLAHSGFPVTLDEPDAVFVHEGVGFGLAVKRPGSERQVIRRIREGVDQLARTGLREDDLPVEKELVRGVWSALKGPTVE